MRQLGRVPAFDGLRAVAVVGVVFAHGWGFDGGQLGVDLFFVLSGFLITSLLLSEWHREGAISLRGFYRRRACRLLPALVLLVTFLAAVDPGHLHADAVALTYASNIVGIENSSLMFRAHLTHLWSLAEEEQFYLLWPLVLMVALRRHARPALLVVCLLGAAVISAGQAALLAAAGASQARIWLGPDTHAYPLLVGCAAGVAWTYGLVRVRQEAGIAAALLAVPAVLFFTATPGTGTLIAPAFALLTAVVLLAVVEGGALSRVLGLRPLVVIGGVSYGIYLWHYAMFRFLGVDEGLVVTAVAVPLSYLLVERPFLRLKRPLARVAGGPVLLRLRGGAEVADPR